MYSCLEPPIRQWTAAAHLRAESLSNVTHDHVFLLFCFIIVRAALKAGGSVAESGTAGPSMTAGF